MANCITDSAYIAAATKQAAAITTQAATDIAIQTAIALWQRNSSQSISNMQTDLADQQVELAENVHEHARQFWPEEAELVTDVFAEARAVPQYSALGAAWSQLADETMQAARQVWLDDQRRGCLNPSRCEDARWNRNTAVARADLGSYAYRQAEAREQISNDRRYARQLAVLGVGRGLVNSLISYQSVSQYSGLSASGMLEGSINSALTVYGYYSERSRPDGWASGIQKTWSLRMPAPANATPAPTLPEPAQAPVAVPPARTGKAAEYDGLDWGGL